MSKRHRPAPPEPGPFHNPFAGLADRLGMPRAAPEAPVAPAAATSPPAATARPGPARAVLRLERKGRGGKEATVIEKLDLPPAEREHWLRELKQALGCGGQIDGEALVLQGDVRARLRPLLERRGVRKVVTG